MKNSYRFFSNTDCKYYPCHKTSDGCINCLFCYCPLYSMGDGCGGNFKMLPGGIKDCSDCTLVHGEKGYDFIMKKLLVNK